jgi:hypothetical protein
MKDVIKFHYAEAQLEITCTVCNVTTMFFPNYDDEIMHCPKCKRGFKFNYSIEIIPEKEVIKEETKHYTKNIFRNNL